MKIFKRDPWRAGFGLALSLLASSIMSELSVAAAAPGDRPLQMSQVPASVASGQSSLVAALAASTHLKLAINLPSRNQAALDQLIAQLYDPTSPNYHHYLSVAEFTDRFGPAQADYDAVVNWATAQGFTVTRTTPNRHIVDIEGSVDTINRALHVSMGTYRRATQKTTFFAPDREPTVDLSVPLLEISGLDNFVPPQRMLRHGDPAMNKGPIANAGGSGPGGLFLPSDMRTAYYGTGPLTGAGQTVGVFSFDGYLASDVQLFYSHTGMSSQVPVNNVLVNGYSGACDQGGETCDDGEQVLDIVNVIGMAPGIDQVLFYEGDDGTDILNQMATDNLAKVLSCSWGSGSLGHGADPIFQELQAQGQTFLNATGDHGAYNAQTWLPPSLNPLTLQIGGTDLTTSSAGGPWASETGWSDGAGGFYAPAGYPIPAFQQLAGVITSANAGSATLRNDPDVSAEANYDNPTVSNGQFLTGYGGTSFAAPRWAGFVALANQQSVANGQGVLGYLNTAIYNLGVGADYLQDFHDVVSGSNPPGAGPGAGFHAVAGYDLITGWGSPNAGLIGQLSGSTSAPGFVLSAYPSNLSVPQGTSVTSAIDVGALNGFGDSVDLGVSGLPSGVTAAFSADSTTAGSTLTFSASASATLGPAVVTVSGSAGSATRTATINLFVGNPAHVTAVTPNPLTFDRFVVLVSQDQSVDISNAANSVPLSYTIAAYASSGGQCSGAVTWLTPALSSGSVVGGQTTAININVTPSAAPLAVGDYTGELCLTTSDAAQPTIAIPVDITVIAGPQPDTLFANGFDNRNNATSGPVVFSIEQAVDDSQAGSALDLATGNYHLWNSFDVDNINLYDDGTGLQVYWYNDQLSGSIATKVGGVADAGGDYQVLHVGDTVGPNSHFTNATSPLTNWWGGTDGYIGIAFKNSQTHVLNYGYVHVTSTAPIGFPAQVLDYGFDNSGAAITIQ